MTYQNRVDPAGTFQAVPAKGTLMGNRGILHDETKTIIRPHNHQNWVTCALSFKGIKRKIMSPRKYTELFFLDEATAFAAGHRPCAECRRERYREFTDAWRCTHGEPEAGRSLPQTIDKALHAARIDRKRRKVTFSAPIHDLPDGTMFSDGDDIVLAWHGAQLLWSFEGYRERAGLSSTNVTVLTPRPVVEVFKNGFTPFVHASAG
ncbi:hypothetical protein [Antarcticimicrobium luteum]|uniref:Uncharacterized protein n=1 Tax=Antarcticimicrobium luteum TaxID=2547397 RepID=A0A4R5VDX9_9RHOB|nr:hypothetical protein [Antarcticimicrobium luteum]TDK50354.1 hypothetical protein E1832_06935 [Antarcticimicrobium luteum]